MVRTLQLCERGNIEVTYRSVDGYTRSHYSGGADRESLQQLDEPGCDQPEEEHKDQLEMFD